MRSLLCYLLGFLLLLRDGGLVLVDGHARDHDHHDDVYHERNGPHHGLDAAYGLSRLHREGLVIMRELQREPDSESNEAHGELRDKGAERRDYGLHTAAVLRGDDVDDVGPVGDEHYRAYRAARSDEQAVELDSGKGIRHREYGDLGQYEYYRAKVLSLPLSKKVHVSGQ